MTRSARQLAAAGALLGAAGIGAGAFGAHALSATLSPRMLEIWDTAVRYHLYGVFGIFAIAWAAERTGTVALRNTGWMMAAGAIVFAGSLYTLALTGFAVLGAITPLGGALMILAWVSLAVTLLRWKE